MDLIDFKNLDKKSKIEIMITSFMVVIFILILVNSIKTIFKSKRSASKDPHLSTDVFKEIIVRDVISPKDIEVIGNQDMYKDIKEEEDAKLWGRDPFSMEAALSDGAISISDLKLEGILSRHGQNPHAIINGEVLEEGDKVGDATIVEISKDTVIVTDGEKNYSLHLW